MGDGERVRWIGFAGVLLLAAVTLLSWVAHPRGWTGGVLLGAALAGMGLLVLAWLALGARVLRALPGARWRAPAVPGAARPVRIPPDATWLRRTLALWGAPLLVVPPLFSGDVYSYLAQGEIAARGLDPYVLGPAQGLGAASAVVGRVAGYWRDTPSPYGPVFTVLERGIAGVVGENPVLGVLAYRLLAVAGLAMVGWALPRLARTAGVPERAALWLGALNPLVLWHFLAGAHNDALMAGLMLAGTAIALEALGERFNPLGFAGGVLVIVLGAEVKVTALAALAVVGVALARWLGGGFGRLLLAGALMVLGFVLVSVVLSVLTGTSAGWLRTLGTSSTVHSWMAPTNWFGFLAGGAGALFGAHVLQPMIALGRVLGDLCAVAGIGYAGWRQLTGRLGPVTALGAVLAVLVVFGPVVQPWYLLWAAVPLAACLAPGRVRLAVTGVTAVFAVLLPPLGGGIGTLLAGYAIGAAAVAVAGYFLFRPRMGKGPLPLSEGWGEPASGSGGRGPVRGSPRGE